MLLTSLWSWVSLWCWCIWMREKLLQTREIFLILPKGGIWHATNIVSTEAYIFSWIQISNIRLYSLHEWNLQHPTLSITCTNVTFLLISWRVSNWPLFLFRNGIMETLLTRLLHLVWHYSISKCNPILITLRLTI